MAAEIKKAGKETIRRLKMAWGFLTVFPTDTGEYKEGDLSRASFFFPAVGAVIGAVNASLFYLLHFLTRDSLLSAFLVTFIWIFLTRGLHLDGLADSFDALFLVPARSGSKRFLKIPITVLLECWESYFCEPRFSFAGNRKRPSSFCFSHLFWEEWQLSSGELFSTLSSHKERSGGRICGANSLFLFFLLARRCRNYGFYAGRGGDPFENYPRLCYYLSSG